MTYEEARERMVTEFNNVAQELQISDLPLLLAALADRLSDILFDIGQENAV